METVSLINFKINNEEKCLDLLINNNENIVFTNARVKSRNTDLKQEINIKTLEANDKNLSVQIPLGYIEFDDISKNILDIYLISNNNIEFQIKMENSPIKEDFIRYPNDEYYIKKNIIAVPYLTKKNNISILYGDVINVVKAFSNVITTEIYPSQINYSYKGLSLYFPTSNLSLSKGTFVVLENKKTKEKETISYDYLISKNEITINIDLLECEINKGDYNLYIIQKNGKIILQRKILFPSLKERLILGHYLNPLLLDSKKWFLPYQTDAGNLSIFLGNRKEIESFTISKASNDIFFKNIDIKNTKILFHISPEFSDRLEGIFQDEFELIIEDKNKNVLHHINKNDTSFANNIFSIELKYMLENLLNIQDNMSIKVKSFGSLVNSEGYDLYLGNKYIELKSLNFAYTIFYEKENRQKLFIKKSKSKKKSVQLKIVNEEAFRKHYLNKVETKYTIENIKVENERLSFTLDKSLKDDELVTFYIKNRKSKEKVYIPHKIKNNKIDLYFSSFIIRHLNENSRWDIFCEKIYENILETAKIGLFSSRVEEKHLRYFSPLNRYDEFENGNIAVPYLSIYNELVIVVNSRMNVMREKTTITSQITSFNMKKSNVSFDSIFNIPDNSKVSLNSVSLVFRNKAIFSKIDLPICSKKQTENKLQINVKFDIESYSFQPFYWDVFAFLEVDGIEVCVKLKNPNNKIIHSINNNTLKYEYCLKDGYIIYPYITLDNSIAFCFREPAVYESKVNKVKEIFAYYIYQVFKSYFNKKDIWLGFEKFSETAQDNGYYFYDYCHKENKHKNFYYVIKKGTQEYKSIKNKGYKIINHMSFKYMLFVFAAKLLISSEAKANLYDIKIQRGKLKEAIDRKKFVFLQHGVIALKKIDNTFKKRKDPNKPSILDLFIVSSKYEKNIVKKEFGYSDKEILMTGLCRWDALEDKVNPKERKIFMMPTWRTWLEGLTDEEFINTDYYKNYVNILTSKKLLTILEKNNITLNFLLHPKFKNYIDQFEINSPNIKINKFGELKVNELLMESSLLITDYSSIAWDMYYMKKPIIFFQFDLNEQLKYQGSYMDMEKELFGDQVFSSEDLIDQINSAITNQFVENPAYTKMRKNYFEFLDRKNCERTYKAITKNKKLLSGN